jgi:hypothetical protein
MIAEARVKPHPVHGVAIADDYHVGARVNQAVTLAKVIAVR